MTQEFYHGALAFGCCTAGVFFLRFHSRTQERLFLFFALAFLAFAANWLGLAIARPQYESRHLLYLVRLAAFALIIAGILDKNRRDAA